MKIRAFLFASSAFLALDHPAYSQTINTMSQWDGVSYLATWGIPNTSTFGQTFTPNQTQKFLTGFTVEIQGYGVGNTPYKAYVYAWDGVNNHITGPALFTSVPGVVPTGGGYQAYSFNTGLLALAPGQQYAVFLSTSGLQGGLPSTRSRWGALNTNAAIPGGQFVFSINRDDFNALSTTSWSAFQRDLAITLNLLSPISARLPAKAPVNAFNVAGGIDNFANGSLPGLLANLGSLSGQQLVNAMLAIDGEAATGAQTASFQLMNQFLGLMLDPFVDGRFRSGTSNFASGERSNLPPEIALAYASVLKAPPKIAENRWSVWGTAFGGTGRTNGDPVIGSNNLTANTYGFSSGADYHFNRDTLAGFALAGAGSNWSLAQFKGSGRSDAFQFGVYGKTATGPLYLAASLAYSESWFTTNRVALGDQMNAKFTGESFGGRLESGYRFVLPSRADQWEVAPYGAIQTQSFHTPNYNETDFTGGALALNYNAMNASDTRSELGARFADFTAISGMPLILRARLAWAHDWLNNPALNATFQALPGTGFIVNGASLPPNSTLASLGAELHVNTRWMALAKFDGEFARGSQTYAGKGTLRYTW